MSNQDPPFESKAKPAGEELAKATETVRSDLHGAASQAKDDFRSAADQAKNDLAALKDQATSQFADLKNEASNQFQGLKSQASNELSHLRSQAEGQLGEAAEKAKAYAGEQVNQLSDRARSFASEQKDLAARQIGGVGDAVSRVADELRAKDSAVAGYAQSIAGNIRQLAESFDNKSVDDLIAQAQDFGRRQPLAFVGIAALAGFAATRFLMASAAQKDAARAGEPQRHAAKATDKSEVTLERDGPRRKGGGSAGGVGNNGRI